MKHHINRTSPKGKPFVGTCFLCGEPNLGMGDALKDCPNVRGLTVEQAMVEAVTPPGREGDDLYMPPSGYRDGNR